MKRLTNLILILLAAASLGACGLRGDLDRPEPMWGHPQDAAEPAADAPVPPSGN